MKNKFELPTTPSIRVVYVRDGVNYGAIIATPQSNAELESIMLAKKVGMSQVQRLEPIKPANPLARPHPAQHFIAKYQTASEQ